MSVYKEMGSAIRELQIKLQKITVFPKNGNVVTGIPVKSKDDPVLQEGKGIMDFYQIKPTTAGVKGSRVQTFLFDGEWPAVIEAGFEKATVKYHETPGERNMIGYITVETSTSYAARMKAREYDR